MFNDNHVNTISISMSLLKPPFIEMYERAYGWTCVCVCVYVCVRVCVCVRACVFINVYKCMYMSIWACIEIDKSEASRQLNDVHFCVLLRGSIPL